MRRAALTLGLLTLAATQAFAQAATQGLRVISIKEFGTKRPVPTAIVADLTGGLSFFTDTAGTLSLTGKTLSTVVVRKLGFLPETLNVATRADANGSVLVELKRIIELAASTTEASRIQMVEERLMAVGFNDRRQGTGAPKTATFVTAMDIEHWKPRMLSDIGNRIGRDLTRCTTYIDGFYTATPRPTRGNPMRKGMDGMIEATDIAGLEIYRVGEAPARYTARSPQQCSLVLWLK